MPNSILEHDTARSVFKPPFDIVHRLASEAWAKDNAGEGRRVRRSEETGFDEKAIHRMLSRRGNPTTPNLAALIHIIAKDPDLHLEVKAA